MEASPAGPIASSPHSKSLSKEEKGVSEHAALSRQDSVGSDTSKTTSNVSKLGETIGTVDDALVLITGGKVLSQGQLPVILVGMLSWVYSSWVVMSLVYIVFMMRNQGYGISSGVVEIANFLVFFGWLMGNLIIGRASDWAGRRPSWLWTLLAGLPIVVAVAFVSNDTFLLLLRFLSGFLIGGGHALVAYVHCSEFFPPKQQPFVALAMCVAWSIGATILAVMAWIMKDMSWRFFSAFMVLPGLVCFFAWKAFVDETPKWLYIQNKLRDSLASLEGIARPNKSTEVLSKFALVENSGVSISAKEFVCVGRYRRNTVSLAVTWFALSLVFYGLSLNPVASKGGNLYLASLLIAAIDLPAYVTGGIVARLFGRRYTYTAFFLVSGISLISTVVIPYGWAKQILELLGKFCISAAFCVAYIYGVELFPTSLRSTGLGFVSLSSRAGGMVCPIVVALSGMMFPGAMGEIAIPRMVFGLSAIIAAGFAVMLPETKGSQSIDDDVMDGGNPTTRGRSMSRTYADMKQSGRFEEEVVV